jgi:hypothetical protein
VWAVLADFPNIADWNGGVKKSYSTGDATSGVGAQRHCDLAPTGALEETIREWTPEERVVISIDSTKKAPVKSGLGTFTLEGDGDSTTVSLVYDFQPRFGPIGTLIGPLLDKQFNKSFTGFPSDLEAAAQKGAAPTASTD